jgi:ribonuclease Z
MPLQRLFHGLLNGSFGDPGLILESGPRATLLDCGDLHGVPGARLHRVREVALTHCHVDHVFGLDALVRAFLGGDRSLSVLGPPETAARVRSKLEGYTWNIPLDFALEISVEEVDLERGRGTTTRLRLEDGLEAPGPPEARALPSREGVAVLAEDARRTLLAAPADHGTPCLAFAYEHRRGVRVRDADLARLGLPRGEWIRGLKAAVLAGAPGSTPVEVPGAGPGGAARAFTLGALASEVAEVLPGVRVAYVTDTRLDPPARARLLPLARGAATLYCEASFLEKDRARALASRHATAREAALFAIEAGARELVLFHPSPRYERDFGVILAEAREVFPRARFQEAPQPAPGTAAAAEEPDET